jgi:hypothetical protein
MTLRHFWAVLVDRHLLVAVRWFRSLEANAGGQQKDPWNAAAFQGSFVGNSFWNQQCPAPFVGRRSDMSRRHVPLAIAYDFDGTLAPGNMQEHQFLPDIGMTADEFWQEAKDIAREVQGDEILIYMNLMLRKAAAARAPVRVEDFQKRGKGIVLFDGVEMWFDRITEYGKAKGVRVDHFVVSSGNHEIILGTPIANKFKKIYASKFMFDANGAAEWPALAVNYTTKTQFLFRINKDAHDLSDSKKVNQFIEKANRPIPFENMMFIGDGATDIPCFRLVKEQGGLSIAVYKPNTKGAREKAAGLLKDQRVHLTVPAIYTEGGELDIAVKANIDLVAARDHLHAQMPTAKGTETSEPRVTQKRRSKKPAEGAAEFSGDADAGQSDPPA